MRVLIVNRHYGDDQVPTARMLTDVVSALIESGADVSILASTSTYAGTARKRVESQTGATVYNVFTPGERWRIVSWLLFLLQAAVRIPFLRWDRCILMTDPPFLGALSVVIRPFALRSRRKLFWWTMDLYPEILVHSGYLKPLSWLYRFMARLNDMTLSRMDGVITLGAAQADRMSAYPAWGSVTRALVPPWDLRPIGFVSRDANRFIQAFNLEAKKIALYAGNLGEAHTYHGLLAAANHFNVAGRDDWVFVFVVRGSKKTGLIADSSGLSNILVCDYQPPELTDDLLWSADLHLITMAEDCAGIVVPSKLYGALQTEAPVLFVGPSDADTAAEIARYEAGASLENSCEGRQIAETMDKLVERSQAGKKSLLPDLFGPVQVAKFVMEM